jgi:hypothetical protein
MHHTKHIAGDEPVVDDHDVEQSYHTGGEVIEVHQVVELRDEYIVNLSTFCCDYASIQHLSNNREDKEYCVERDHHG